MGAPGLACEIATSRPFHIAPPVRDRRQPARFHLAAPHRCLGPHRVAVPGAVLRPDQIEAVLQKIKQSDSRKPAADLRRDLTCLQRIGPAAKRLPDKKPLMDARDVFEWSHTAGEIQQQEKCDLQARHRREEQDMDSCHQFRRRSC